MGSYLRQDFSGGWVPSADNFNAPKNALLRADNLVLDERGALALRQGSAKVNISPFTDTDVHSLASFTLSGSLHRMSGCTDAVYDNGVSILSGLDGTGDVSFGSHMGQILFARGATKKKYDGTVRNWGIVAPGNAPVLSILPPDSKTFATCDSTELPVFTSNEGTQTFVTDRFSRTNGAMQIAPDTTTGRGISTKTFTAPQDFTVYDAGGIGADRDLIDFYAYITEPQLNSGITIMIDVNTGDFQNDWYEYTFFQGDAIEVVQTTDDALASNYTVEGVDRDIVRAQLDSGISGQSLQTKVATITGWNHFQVPRGTMVRHGLSAGKDWSTVMAVRVLVLATAGGSSTAVKFDDIKIVGAGGLTGKYTTRVVAAYDNGTYVALSGPSDISNEVQFQAQGATVTLDATTVTALDAQVTQIWAYIMGGRLNAFYRAATAARSATPGAFDHTASFETAYFTALEGIANFTNLMEAPYGGTIGPKSHTASWESAYLILADPWSVNITDSEIEILIADERLETDNTTPPDDIIGIEGPHFDRTLVLTQEFLYPSRELDPDAFSQGEVVRVGDATEQALWIKKLDDSSVYVGTTKDIYRFDGDWTPQPDGSINVVKRPMHAPNPPVSDAVTVGKINGINTLIYLAGNGWTILGGGTLTDNAVDLLWRGFTRHDVQPVNITDSTARFRIAVCKNVLFAITPEAPATTSSNILHVYHFTHQRWYRFRYPYLLRSIGADRDGTLVAGDSTGYIRQLDLATKQDDGVDIPVELWTPIDDNGEAFTYKDPENMWLRCDTGDNTATIALHVNGAGVASTTQTTAQEQTGVMNADVTACPEFSQLQLRITGDFNTFVFRQWALRYIDNPVPQVVHDTGPIDLSQDAVKWVRRLRIKAKSPVDLTVQPYWDGDAATARTITVGSEANTAGVFEVPLGRQDYGRVGRVVISSATPSHVYWIEFQLNGSGAQNQKRYVFQPEAA